MNRKGVCYDVGRVLMGGNWRPRFDPGQVGRELTIIRDDLHCNAVRIQGLEIERLVTASEAALPLGLEVWMSPEMWDRPQGETLEYVVEAAEEAEELRRRWPGRVVFSVGSELTLFSQGMVEGDGVFDRMSRPSFWHDVMAGRHNGPLNSYLSGLSKGVRKVFQGPLTYFSVPLETVDWEPFDFVGVDLYRDARMRDTYGQLVAEYNSHGKPVVIGEFGCCTFRGADLLGGNGFMVAFGMMEGFLGPDHKIPKMFMDMAHVPPRVDGHYIRDEGLQARELSDQLRVLDSAGIEGAFVFNFVSPNSPHREDPRFDSDLASFSLVKSYAESATEGEFRRQTANQARALLGVEVDPGILQGFSGALDRHGVTYPDMPWEPKESFRAVAEYYADSSAGI